MGDVLRLMSDYGIAVTVAAAFIVGVGYMLVRLFGADGILTRIGNRMVEYIDQAASLHATIENNLYGVASTQKSLVEVVERHYRASERQAEKFDEHREEVIAFLESVADPEARYSVARLHRAALKACDLIEETAKQRGVLDQVKPDLDTIRTILRDE